MRAQCKGGFPPVFCFHTPPHGCARGGGGESPPLGNLKIALRGGGGGGQGRPPNEAGGGWRNGVPCRALCFV